MAECETIQDEVDGLERQLEAAEDELNEVPPVERGPFLQRIGSINRRLSAARNRLAGCLAAANPPPGPPIEARFVGTATLTTTFDQASGPYVENVAFNVVLDGARTMITLVSFPIITETFEIDGLGENTTTITRRGGGTGSYNAGSIVLPLALRFDHSIDIPFFQEDSDFNVVLTTAPPGSPLTPEPYGNVTLAGSAVFSGGVLAGDTGTLVVTGTISQFTPPPPVTVPDVRESLKGDAIAELRAVGLGGRSVGTDGPDAWVYRQAPPAGTIVPRGSIVTLQLRVGPRP
jgi:PASTA domain